MCRCVVVAKSAPQPFCDTHESHGTLQSYCSLIRIVCRRLLGYPGLCRRDSVVFYMTEVRDNGGLIHF